MHNLPSADMPALQDAPTSLHYARSMQHKIPPVLQISWVLGDTFAVPALSFLVSHLVHAPQPHTQCLFEPQDIGHGLRFRHKVTDRGLCRVSLSLHCIPYWACFVSPV